MLSELDATHHLVNTVIQLARDIICVNQSKSITLDGVDIMQSYHGVTSLRVIAHSKRGKMDDIEIRHGKLSNVKKGSDDI